MHDWITGLLASAGLALVVGLIAFGLQSWREGERRAARVAVGLAARYHRSVTLLDLDLRFGDAAYALMLAPQHTMADAVGALGSALHSQNESSRLKAAALVLRMSGLQEQLKLSRQALVKEDDPWEMLSQVIGEVALELGFREPGTPPPEAKQLAEGKPAQE